MNRNYISLLWLLAGILFISSCKQDQIFGDIDPNTDRIIIEFADAKNLQSVAMDYSTDVIEVDLAEIRFMGRSYVTNNVTARVTSSADVVNDYNNDNGTNYTPVPAGVFGFEPNEIVLTPTERKKKVHIRIRSSDISTGEYAIGLSIAEVSAGEVSQVAGTILIVVSVKNKYDGVYDVTGSCVDALGAYTGIYPNNGVELRTVDASSVDYLDPTFDVGAPFFNNAYIIENISTGNPAWLYSPRFVFNTTTDKVTAILDTDGLVPIGVIDPAGPNQFTMSSPDSKQFVIKYSVIGGRFTITETWTYTGPR